MTSFIVKPNGTIVVKPLLIINPNKELYQTKTQSLLTVKLKHTNDKTFVLNINGKSECKQNKNWILSSSKLFYSYCFNFKYNENFC